MKQVNPIHMLNFLNDANEELRRTNPPCRDSLVFGPSFCIADLMIEKGTDKVRDVMHENLLGYAALLKFLEGKRIKSVCIAVDDSAQGSSEGRLAHLQVTTEP